MLTGKEGMGYGDFKLLAALGAWLGWAGDPAHHPDGLRSSGCASICRAASFLAMTRTINIRSGPFLAGGGLIVMFVGADPLLAWAGISFTR